MSRRPFPAARKTSFLAVCALSLLPLVAAAQVDDGPTPDAPSGPGFSFDPDDNVQAGAGLDSINPYNGALSLAIPLGPVYQAGPGLSFQLRLYYSSRVWAPGTWALWGPPTPYTPEPYMVLQGDPALGLGWSFSLGKIVEAGTGVPAAYIGPDGSAHRLYNKRIFNTGASDGFFYTRDGSYLRVKYTSGSGYQMWTPNGNLTTFGKQIGPPATITFDDPPTNYQNDYGRGRNGWYVTAMANAYQVAGEAITVTYQASPSVPWVPYQITIPSVGGGSARILTVNMSGNLISGFTVPTFNGVNADYTLTHNQHGTIQRPITHPTPPPNPPDPNPYFLEKITLPYTHTYTFGYYSGSVRYAKGALSSQTIPTGATITYDYGTWTFYHANPLNRPGPPIVTCQYPPPVGFPGSTLRTGPGLEPSPLPPVGDCASPDRAAGIVSRIVSYTLLSGTATSTTKYYQYNYPKGESSSDTATQTQTLVLSPADDAGKVHSTTYLFTGSTDKWVAGPLVGSLVRQAVFAGDQSAGPPSDTTSAERVWRFTYDMDAYDPNPNGTSSESFEANRRMLQSVVIYKGIARTSPPSGKYHTVDCQFDANAGQYSKETHSGTVGGSLGSDARESQTVWMPPLADSTHWKLDRPQTTYLRATSGGTNFSQVDYQQYDSAGFPAQTVTTDGASPSYGSLTRTTPHDTDGFPRSETVVHGSTSYTRNFGFYASTLQTSQWSGFSWYAVNNSQIDGSTGLVKTARQPGSLATESDFATDFTYDLLSRPLKTTPQFGDAETSITYVDPTHTTSATTSNSGTVEYSWSEVTTDTLGRTIKVRRKMPAGTSSPSDIVKKITKYDAQGRTVFDSEWVSDTRADTDTSFPGTKYTNFDDFGRAKTVTRADATQTTVDYSDTSTYPDSIWLKSVTTSVGGQSALTKYFSDAFGNLVKVTDPLNFDTGYAYNPQNRLTCVKQGGTNDMAAACTSNGAGQYRSYTYDAFGFLRKENLPEKLNQDVTYSYDALGNVTVENQPAPQSVTLNRTYDGAGRLTEVKSSAIQYVTHCYDGSGPCPGAINHSGPGGSHPSGKLTHRIGYNPADASARKIEEDFEFADQAGRLSLRRTSISSNDIPAVTESWIYNKAGQVVHYNHPRSSGLFAVETSYDHGYPMAVWANGLPVVASPGTVYQPSGLLATYITGNNTGHNVTTTTAADPNSMPRPNQIYATEQASGARLFDTGTYSYDGVGNITFMDSDSFGYDKLSRLTSAALSGLSSQSYTYDSYGNLTGTTGVNPRPYSVSTSSNRLTSAGTSYDSRGNLKTVGSDTYTWDDLDRTVRYQRTGGVDWHYVYSGAGERLLKIPLSGGPANYVWTFRDEANRIATEYSGPSGPIVSRDNVYLGNLLVGSLSTCAADGFPGWRYYSSDHLGTPRLVTDASAVTQDLRKYWPYGDEASFTQPSTSAVRLRLAGMELDREEGANRYYDHARSYDFQALGRFLTPDTGQVNPTLPLDWNRYTYARDNPLYYIDPTGKQVSALAWGVAMHDPRAGAIMARLPQEMVVFAAKGSAITTAIGAAFIGGGYAAAALLPATPALAVSGYSTNVAIGYASTPDNPIMGAAVSGILGIFTGPLDVPGAAFLRGLGGSLISQAVVDEHIDRDRTLIAGTAALAAQFEIIALGSAALSPATAEVTKALTEQLNAIIGGAGEALKQRDQRKKQCGSADRPCAMTTEEAPRDEQ